ncbi:MAG: hypothetical protein JXQ73_20080 [Phycisphaerae bacterium]|nr:hypothetical protein [Phycisphaerae bacterium]
MVMVSHMDGDHVTGVLSLIEELSRTASDHGPREFDVEHLWFNAFDDIVGNDDLPRLSGLAPSATVADLARVVPELSSLENHVAAVIATTGQGRRLRDDARRLHIPVNEPFDPPGPDMRPLVRADVAESDADWGDGLTIRVLHPDHQRLKEMRTKWDNDLKKAKRTGDDSIIIAAYKDKSPFNLASIVVLVELAGKRILLTGDARGDDIVKGLRRADLMDEDDQIHVDILKIPHHGSNRNVSPEFFKQVTADHYVISGNGENDNPDRDTLNWISTARQGDDDFSLHLTNREGKKDLEKELDDFIKDEKADGRTYRIRFRNKNALSLKIDLKHEIDY